jgi:CheY-like chemotaxis protein
VTRILYVEDNDDNVYTLKLRFGLLDGFEVLIAENGRQPTPSGQGLVMAVEAVHHRVG